jgi:hypothetical protein
MASPSRGSVTAYLGEREVTRKHQKTVTKPDIQSDSLERAHLQQDRTDTVDVGSFTPRFPVEGLRCSVFRCLRNEKEEVQMS